MGHPVGKGRIFALKGQAMIYMTAESKHLVVLETGNLEKLKLGKPAVTPDGEIVLCWTPDPVWLADRIIDAEGDITKIVKLIEECSKRPQKPSNRPHHEPHVKFFGGRKG